MSKKDEVRTSLMYGVGMLAVALAIDTGVEFYYWLMWVLGGV